MANKPIPEYTKEDLIQGKDSSFWKLLNEVIKYNIETLRKQIVDDDNLTDSQRGLLRKWLKLNEELLDLPDKILASLEKGVTDMESLDPYYQTYLDIVNDAQFK